MDRLEVGKEQAALYPRQPKLLAVTGTNGKTSVVDYIRQIFDFNNIKSASIGSLGCVLGSVVEATYKVQTTYVEPTLPGPKVLYKLLDELSEHVEYLALEATSHGLHQCRMHEVKIESAGLTNITQDHLDYHKTMDEYKRCKMILFKDLLHKDKFAVFNKAIPYFEDFAKTHQKYINYGTICSDVFATYIKQTIDGISYTLNIFGEKFERTDNIFGAFQLENIMCAICMLLPLGKLSYPTLKSPKGRLEKVRTFKNANVFVDYAHTPDALLKSLQTLKDITKGKLVVVFGCGGDRDKTKRALMGEVAESLCDVVIITDDNPRFEDPKAIREEIAIGCKNTPRVFDDRKNAIIYALNEVSAGDSLLVAGKGHETYQIIGDQKFYFSDHDVILNA